MVCCLARGLNEGLRKALVSAPVAGCGHWLPATLGERHAGKNESHAENAGQKPC